jgi:hypothetical protein
LRAQANLGLFSDGPAAEETGLPARATLRFEAQLGQKYTTGFKKRKYR